MNIFRNPAVIGLLAAMAIAPVARAEEFHPRVSVAGFSSPANEPSSLALEEYYTGVYAHDPRRPPLVIVNHPIENDYPRGVVRARY